MPDILLGGIAINEVLVDPNGANNFDTDGNGNARGGDEFIELVNTSGTAIDISGLELWDAGRDNWFTFPPGSVLQPGARALVVRNVQNGGDLPTVSGDDLAFDADFGQNVFNNGGDNIVVYDPANDEFIQATYNGDTLDDPTDQSSNAYDGFSATATRVGAGEDFGTDQDGFSVQRFGTGFVNDETPTPGGANVCFATGTQILTKRGFIPVEALQVGDLIATQRSGFQPIRWIFARRVSIAEQLAQPKLRPVEVMGGMGLRVSRQHRLLICGKIAQRMFGENELLVPAKDLLAHPDVQIATAIRPVQYFHLLFEQHHVLNANGVAVESLYLGDVGLQAMSQEALAELVLIMGRKQLAEACQAPHSGRPFAAGRRVRHLVQRHLKNNRGLVTPF